MAEDGTVERRRLPRPARRRRARATWSSTTCCARSCAGSRECSTSRTRLRLLLDAVVTMAADLSLDGVLSRIVAIASTLVDAQYAALGVLDTGRSDRLRTFIHHGMDPTSRSPRSASCPRATVSWA